MPEPVTKDILVASAPIRSSSSECQGRTLHDRDSWQGYIDVQDPSALKRIMFTARFAFGLSSRVAAATITLAYQRDSGLRFSIVIAVTILA
ncbi:hypothetical protein AMTR_s00037p00080090 [Amborella trichopoda]|uniref:Uncharacterized protein n=1 Tax=Amborella trichopoda TaxID=13333 RepID=U5CVG1_AMBTC|nr:hypothetical protein AMTR_s00037p00080090 [Amborella trichopoda]